MKKSSAHLSTDATFAGGYDAIFSKRKVGDFSGLCGATTQDILKAIPARATVRLLKPIAGAVQEGIEYKWVEAGVTWRVRIHGPDLSAPPGTNAFEGWVVRVFRGHNPMDADCRFHARSVHNPDSPHYDPTAANETHIPIRTPKDASDCTR